MLFPRLRLTKKKGLMSCKYLNKRPVLTLWKTRETYMVRDGNKNDVYNHTLIKPLNEIK